MKSYNCNSCYMAGKKEFDWQRVCRKFHWTTSPEGLTNCEWGVDDQDMKNAWVELMIKKHISINKQS